MAFTKPMQNRIETKAARKIMEELRAILVMSTKDLQK